MGSNDRVSVVVTGLGATTPLGGDVASTWSAMLAGTSGVRRLTEPWVDDLPVKIAAPAAVDPVAIIGKPQARKMDRYEQLAMVAAREAWADAGSPAVDPYRLGVAVTSGIGGIGSTLAAYDTLTGQGWNRISPFTVPMLMPNGAAGWLSIEFGAKAGAHAPVSACASGAEAIGYGIDMIRSGRADVVIAGGAEAAIMALNLGAFAVMRAMSTRNDEPERASRPFDKGRDGFVLGEGAGVVILESLEHALARDARIYAVAAGAGYSSDAHHISLGAPDGEGVKFAINAALRDAAVSPAQVVHVNAHATSTPGGDPLEAEAIQAAFGADAGGVVVSATKSMTGHLLGGAGAVESVAAIMALVDRMAPPTINLDDPDDDLGIDIATKPRPLTPGWRARRWRCSTTRSASAATTWRSRSPSTMPEQARPGTSRTPRDRRSAAARHDAVLPRAAARTRDGGAPGASCSAAADCGGFCHRAAARGHGGYGGRPLGDYSSGLPSPGVAGPVGGSSVDARRLRRGLGAAVSAGASAGVSVAAGARDSAMSSSRRGPCRRRKVRCARARSRMATSRLAAVSSGCAPLAAAAAAPAAPPPGRRARRARRPAPR